MGYFILAERIATLSRSLLFVRPRNNHKYIQVNILYNMGSVAVHKACDRIGLVAKHIFESISFNHIYTIVAVTTTKIPFCQQSHVEAGM